MWKSEALPYGRLRLPGSRKTIFAHRYSYMLAHNIELRKDQFVCHSCDNPACVNPDHLFLGDKYANMDDRDNKGRQRMGENHGNAILTDNDIRAIRKSSGTLKELGLKFGTHYSNIALIKKGLAWKHVT